MKKKEAVMKVAMNLGLAEKLCRIGMKKCGLKWRGGGRGKSGEGEGNGERRGEGEGEGEKYKEKGEKERESERGERREGHISFYCGLFGYVLLCAAKCSEWILSLSPTATLLLRQSKFRSYFLDEAKAYEEYLLLFEWRAREEKERRERERERNGEAEMGKREKASIYERERRERERENVEREEGKGEVRRINRMREREREG